VEALKTDELDEVQLTKSIPLENSENFCHEIVQYVSRTSDDLVRENAVLDTDYKNNQYIQNNGCKSLLCMPIIYQGQLKGIIYLENNLSANVFNSKRMEILKILTSQIAISIDKAQLYENLEEVVEDRTKQLELANQELKELSLLDPLTKLHNI
jgi:histidine kinase